MKRTWWLAAVSAAALMGCPSSEYSQGPLKLKWKPPEGVKLESEEAGPPAVGHFTGGVEVFSIPADAPALRTSLDAVREQLQKAARVTVPGEVTASSDGDIPAGPVSRWEVRDGDSQRLVYYLPHKDRFVLMVLTAPGPKFDRRSQKFELSLATLKLE